MKTDIFDRMINLDNFLTMRKEQIEQAMAKVRLDWSHSPHTTIVTLSWVGLSDSFSNPYPISLSNEVPDWLVESPKLQETLNWMLRKMLETLKKELGV